MLNNFVLAEESSEVFVSYGKVITNKDGIIEIVGLEDVVVGEVVNIGNDSVGLIMNIETSGVKALVLGDDTKIMQDDLVIPSGSLFYVPVGSNLLGRVVDCLGITLSMAKKRFHMKSLTILRQKLRVLLPVNLCTKPCKPVSFVLIVLYLLAADRGN